MRYGDKNVITGIALITWNGLVPPDKDDRTGEPIWTLGIAFPHNAPEFNELDALAREALARGVAAGTLTATDYSNQPGMKTCPFIAAEADKYGPLVTGMVRISTKSRQSCPDIVDAAGAVIPPTQVGKMLYAGAHVKALVHAYPYNKAGNKGVAFGLDGVQIIDATNAPKLDVGGGLSSAEVRQAFGAAPAAPAAPAPAPVAMPTVPQTLVTPDPSILAGPPAVPAAPTVPTPPPAGPKVTPLGASKGLTLPVPQSWRDGGWTDDVLRTNGFIE